MSQLQRTMNALLLTLLLQLPAADAADPRIVEVGMVVPNIVAVTIHEGSVSLGSLVPYEAQPNDEIKVESIQRSSVRRDGQEIGTLAGPAERRMLRAPDRFTGNRLDRERLANPSSWSIPRGPTVKSVSFKNRVLDAANVQWGD